jgi:hypothetical protein
MAKKHKCIECDHAMNWAVPSCKGIEDKSEWNIRRLRRLCLETIVCGRTMKTKNVDHEQYCKHFEEARYRHINMEAQKVKWEERMGELDG